MINEHTLAQLDDIDALEAEIESEMFDDDADEAVRELTSWVGYELDN